MKLFYGTLRARKFGFLAALTIISGSSFAALNGNYTINANAAASSTNYKTFSSLASDLTSGTRSDGGTANGAGVTGPVVVDVIASSGPYTEQVAFGAISGVSGTNTITINGNGETLQFTATNSAASYTFQLNGTDFMKVNNLKIIALSSSIGRCVHLMTQADNNRFNNCTFQMPNMTSTSNIYFYFGITNGTSSTQTYADAGRNDSVTNCVMNARAGGGPYSGIVVMDESSGSTVKRNVFDNNKIRDFYYYGFWSYYAFNQIITNNEFWNTGTTSAVKYGMYNYCYNKGGDYTIENNYIHDLSGTTTQYGIYHYAYYGTGSNGMNVNKNRIVMLDLPTTAYGIYVYGYYSSVTGAYSTSDNYIQMEKRSTINNTMYGLYSFGAYYFTYFSRALIDRNTIRMIGYSCYPLYGYIYYNQSMSARNSISNNIVDVQTDYYSLGIYAYCYYNNQPVDMCYNTSIVRNLSTSTYTKYLMYAYYVDGRIHNNNFVNLDNGGTNYGLYDYYSTGTFSNNNFYDGNLGSNFYYGARNGSTTADLSAYKTTFGDTKGTNINPMLANIPGGDYKPTSFNFVNLGVPVSGITTDNAGVTRNATTPDVGALEFYIDVALSNLTFSKTQVCGGYKENLTVTVTNNNTVDIQNVPIAFEINGTRKVVEVMTTKIGPGKSADFTFATPAEFNFPGTSVITVFLSGTDDNPSNNLVTKSVTVIPSPFGGSLAETTNYPGYFRQGGSGGSKANPDVTIPDLEVKYDINNPTGYATSSYGSAWDMVGVYMTSGGQAITSGVSYTAPSGSTLGQVSFKPSTALMDSMVYIGVKATNKTTLCDSTFGRWIYVPHVPTVNFSFNTPCDGDVLEFKNLTTIAKGNLLYDWQFNDPNSTEDATDVSDPVYKYVTFGNYTVDLTIRLAAYPKFTFVKSQTITVTPKPTIDFKVLNACEKLPVTFVNDTKLPAGIIGTITYNWNYGGAGTGDPVTTKNPKYTYTKAGGYQVTLTATSNGCSSTITKNANQFALPKAAFTKSGTCNLEEINFTNNSTIAIGNTGYTWSFGDGNISNVKDPKHVFQTAGSKTVKLMAISEFGCKDSASVTFNLAESPKADFSFSDPCNLTAVKFTRTGTIPTGVNSIYEWDFSGEGSSTNENPSHMFNSLGYKEVSLIVRSANGCSDNITKSFPVKLQAKANFSAKDVCEGDQVAFTNSSTVAAGNLVYEWRFGDGNTSLKTSPKHAYAVTGNSKTFLVTLVANVPDGCSDSITKPVTVNAKADPTFTATVQGRTVKFNQTTKEATNSYNWRFGDGGSDKTIDPVYVYSNVDQGTFQACLGIINAAGCLSESCSPVTINLLSVNDINSNGLTIYPNPSTGKVNISFTKAVNNANVAVFNALGEMVLELNHVNGASATADLSSMHEGVYVIKVSQNGESSTQRVVITR